MSKQTPSTDAANPLAGIKQAQEAGKKGKGLPPVHLWNPEFCGDLDMRIARDGTWFYMGTPIGRKPLVRLFSTVLRHDEDGKYYLVTPVEKVGITVDDAPFVAIAMTAEGVGHDQCLTFVSNVGDQAEAGPEHPLRFEFDPETQEPSPYVHIRTRLEALINRPVFYDLVNLGTVENIEGVAMFGIWSGGEFFAMAPEGAVKSAKSPEGAVKSAKSPEGAIKSAKSPEGAVKSANSPEAAIKPDKSTSPR